MDKLLRLSQDLDLPRDLVTQKVAILARSGAGKTYTAGKMAEILDDAGAQIVIVDPVGNWWGLRLAANGIYPGIEIPILGGDHGDIPLEPTAGAVVADFIVDSHRSVVLDLTGFGSLAEQRRFVTAFATRLLSRKRGARTPLMVFWEEAQEFVPQKVSSDVSHMVGAMERLVKLGRNFGIGTTLISQRPQSVNKDVLSQTELLLVGQLNHVLERAAVKAWVREKSAETKDDLDLILPSLQEGVFYAWSPQWLRLFKRVKVGKKWTYDASSTPTLGGIEEERQLLAPVDLTKLQAAMAETIERLKEQDPAELRRRLFASQKQIADLRRQLGERPPAADPKQVLALEVELWALKTQMEQHAVSAAVTLDRVRAIRGQLGLAVPDPGTLRIEPPPARVPDDLHGQVRPEAVRLVEDMVKKQHGGQLPRGMEGLERPLRRQTSRPVATAPASGASELRGTLPQLKGALRILVALASRRPHSLTKQQVATLSGFSTRSSTFDHHLSALRKPGLLVSHGGLYNITVKGIELLGADCPDAPATTEELVALWKAKLPDSTGRILDILVQLYPNSITRDDLAQRCGMSTNSSTYDHHLSALRSNGLLDGPRAGLRASNTLFAEAAR